MADISRMTKDDIPFAIQLTDAEDWGYLEDDFKRLVELDPDGCFVARDNETPVGIVSTSSYGNYAFIGTLIVDESERGRGIGEKLMNHAMEHLRSNGISSFELDAVFQAVPLYRKLGFIDKYYSLRMFRDPDNNSGVLGSCPSDLLGQVIKFDRESTGLDRKDLLIRYFEEMPEHIYAIRKRKVTAYAIVRPRAGDYWAIGPCVADNPDDAETLLSALINKYGSRKISIGFPCTNMNMMEIAAKLGFQYDPPSLRMYSGDRPDYEGKIYGIFSAEKG